MCGIAGIFGREDKDLVRKMFIINCWCDEKVQ